MCQITVFQAFNSTAWCLTVCLNYIQLCKASRGPPSDIRIPAERPLSSGGDGEPLRCHHLLQQPIWSEWETTVRNLWWTVTNQAIKCPCWQQLYLLIMLCRNTVTRSFSDSSALRQCANSVLTLTCQSRSYCRMSIGGWEGHSIGHADPELESLNDLCYRNCQAASWNLNYTRQHTVKVVPVLN